MQVHVAVGSRAVQYLARARFRPCALDRLTQRFGVERQVHGVARARVRQLEIELGGRGLADAGVAERNARGREPAQCLPGIGDDGLRHRVHLR